MFLIVRKPNLNKIMKKKFAIIVLTGIFIQAAIACKEDEELLQNDFQVQRTEVIHYPDFDDTPLWDENADRNYADDGIIWHPHWVVLNEDTQGSRRIIGEAISKG